MRIRQGYVRGIASLVMGDAPTTHVASSVNSYLSSSKEAQIASLSQLHASGEIYSSFSRVSQCSEKVLPFLSNVRSRCSSFESGNLSPWAREVDLAALKLLKILYGPAFTPIQQLDPHCSDPWMRSLVTSAELGETVRPSQDPRDFAIKFGWRRLVHGLHHHSKPEELLAVLYTALLSGMPPSIHWLEAQSGGAGPGVTSSPPAFRKGVWKISDMLDGDARMEPPIMTPLLPTPTTAAFYSVGSPASVAKGLKLGTRIIYSLASTLAHSAPSLRTFCTLSPVPGFMNWLRDEDTRLYGSLMGSHWWKRGDGEGNAINQAASRALAAYILHARDASGRGPACRVAAFHFGNGAKLGRICGGADTTAGGLKRSAGFMVNYVYSESGAEGLARTMEEGAPKFAADPERVIGEQEPLFVWS